MPAPPMDLLVDHEEMEEEEEEELDDDPYGDEGFELDLIEGGLQRIVGGGRGPGGAAGQGQRNHDIIGAPREVGGQNHLQDL